MTTETYMQAIRIHFPGMNVQEAGAVLRVIEYLTVCDNDLKVTDFETIRAFGDKFIDEKLDEMERDMK